MPIGNLATEADLQRFIEEQLDQRLRALESKIAALEQRLLKAGIP